MTDNQRTSILIEDGERGRIRVKLTRAPGGRPGPGKLLPPIELELPQDVENAREYGAALHKKLCKEPELRGAVAAVLRARENDVWPLCFKIEGGELGCGQEMLWEALWVQDLEFLALRPQWPIARLVDSETTARVYQAPLKILAIMSAQGVSAREDWEGIRSALEEARARDFPVHVTVIVRERELLRDLRALEEKQVQDRDRWLTVVPLEDQQTIDQHLGDRPHVLHFFCHGTVQYGGGSLSLATIADRAEGPDGPESVSVDIYRLRKLVSDRMLWLVTLNCCSGAQSTGKTQSLAQVVVEAGAGAALGWRTPVAPEDAHVLCRTVYSGLLRLVRETLDGVRVNTTVPLELATLGYDLRDALRSKHRDGLEWALPVLFVAGEPLWIMVAAPKPDDPEDLSRSIVSPADARRIEAVVTRQTLLELGKIVPELEVEPPRPVAPAAVPDASPYDGDRARP